MIKFRKIKKVRKISGFPQVVGKIEIIYLLLWIRVWDPRSLNMQGFLEQIPTHSFGNFLKFGSVYWKVFQNTSIIKNPIMLQGCWSTAKTLPDFYKFLIRFIFRASNLPQTPRGGHYYLSEVNLSELWYLDIARPNLPPPLQPEQHKYISFNQNVNYHVK